jgi:hypothetical protein
MAQPPYNYAAALRLAHGLAKQHRDIYDDVL